MSQSPKRFLNAILCEDIRDEIGNKKSLMGVLAADVLVPSFPAPIQIAVFFQYVPDKDDGKEISIDVRFLDNETEMMKATSVTTLLDQNVVTVAIPKGIATFEKETTFRVLVSINKGTEQEIMTKKVIRGPTS